MLIDPLRSHPIVMSLGQILESMDRPLFQIRRGEDSSSTESEPQNTELRTAECRRKVKSGTEEKPLNSQFTSSLDIPELFNVAVATRMLQGSRCFPCWIFLSNFMPLPRPSCSREAAVFCGSFLLLFDPLRSHPIVKSLGQILESADRPLFRTTPLP